MPYNTVFPLRELGDVCRVGDGAHSKVERRDSGVLYLTSKNIGDGRLLLDKVDYISEADYNRRFPVDSDSVRRPRDGDVLVGIIGTFGNAYLYRPADHFGISSSVAIIRPDPDQLSPSFLSYVVRSSTFRAAHLSYKSGSVQGYTNLPTLRRLPVPLPPLSDQRRIAAVLGALDDKIELNRQMNATLEATAQALFEHWFVDFGEEEKLVDSGVEKLGLIPEGWEAGTFGDVAERFRNSVQPDDMPPDTPYIGLGDMPERSMALTEWGKASDVSSTKVKFSTGDILFGRLRPYFKKVGVAPRDGICSSDIYTMRPLSPEWYGYTLGLLTHDPFIDYTEAVSTGTRMPRVNWKSMSRYPIAIPPTGIAARFDRYVRSVVARILANIDEVQTLAQLRDTLLPKLISGEIRVSEAEELVEEVA